MWDRRPAAHPEPPRRGAVTPEPLPVPPAGQPWDAHGDTKGENEKICGITDLPVAGFPAPPPSKSIPIPDVVGQNVADARKALEAAGFSVTVALEKSSKPAA